MKTEPILIKAGDKRILINGVPPIHDIRLITEDNYQFLFKIKEQFQKSTNLWWGYGLLFGFFIGFISGVYIEFHIK